MKINCVNFFDKFYYTAKKLKRKTTQLQNKNNHSSLESSSLLVFLFDASSTAFLKLSANEP